ncbi:choice-of-anchor J domain-containing protein [candidate division KSB1 bacterium]
MNKILSIIILILTVNISFCQSVLEEGFETWPPAGWTIVDSDGDTNQWEQGSVFNGWTVNSGNHCATSASWSPTSGPLFPDNWLISPQIMLVSGNSYKLSWWVNTLDSIYPDEYYGVLISTSDSIQTFISLFEDTTVYDTSYTYKELNISSYAGQNVYIAFRHFNVSNQFYLNIDDVSVEQTVGIYENAKIVQLDIFPNPVSDKLHIISNEELIRLRLYNNIGSLILEKEIKDFSCNLQFSSLEKGVYYLNLETKKGAISRIITKI